MELFKVPNNFQLPITPFKVEKIISDEEFEYLNRTWFPPKLKKLRFIPDYPNGNHFFRTKEEAIAFKKSKIEHSIKKHEQGINKAKEALKNL